MGEILDGKKLSEDILAQVANETNALKKNGIFPKLCVILVGENPASISYVNMKHRACERTGIESQILKFSENIAQDALLSEIRALNNDSSVSGILVQLPLPKHINTDAVLEAIAPSKDVDGFHPYNVGRLVANCAKSCCNSPKDNAPLPILAPATPLGIMELLRAYNIEVSGKNVAIIGASNIVGKPLSALMLNAGATVSICHILTKDISVFTKSADIVCVGVGKVNLITSDMVKNGAIVVDIGINKVNGKIKGDVDFEAVAQKASFITPVPGGVGPMTIAMLLKNTLLCAQNLGESRMESCNFEGEKSLNLPLQGYEKTEAIQQNLCESFESNAKSCHFERVCAKNLIDSSFERLCVAFCKTAFYMTNGFLNLARKFTNGASLAEMPQKPKWALNRKANDLIANLGESKNFNDSTPLHNFTPPPSPLPQGEGESLVSYGLTPTYFLKKSKQKTLDCDNFRKSCHFERSEKSIKSFGLNRKANDSIANLDESNNFKPHPLTPSAREGEKLECRASPQPPLTFLHCKKDSCDSTLESRQFRGAKNREQGRSSASADFLLEADKRGTPPKSEKRQLLARRGSGVGGAALLRKKTSESKNQNNVESVGDSCKSKNFCLLLRSKSRWGLGQSPAQFNTSPSLAEGVRGRVNSQNPKDSRESSKKKLDSSDSHRTLKKIFAYFFLKSKWAKSPKKKTISTPPSRRGLGGGVSPENESINFKDSRKSHEPKRFFAFAQKNKMQDSCESKNFCLLLRSKSKWGLGQSSALSILHPPLRMGLGGGVKSQSIEFTQDSRESQILSKSKNSLDFAHSQLINAIAKTIRLRRHENPCGFFRDDIMRNFYDSAFIKSRNGNIFCESISTFSRNILHNLRFFASLENLLKIPSLAIISQKLPIKGI